MLDMTNNLLSLDGEKEAPAVSRGFLTIGVPYIAEMLNLALN
jgi:hypothetical protein